MRAVRKKNIKERILAFIAEQEVGTIEAFVLTGEELSDLSLLPLGPTSCDPMGVRAIERKSDRYYVAEIPVYHEGEPGCPK